MIWNEIIEKYGKDISDKMKDSKMLCCITVEIKNGEFDYPERNIEIAYRDVTGIDIHYLEWD